MTASAAMDIARTRQELMASSEFRDMLATSDAFRHSCFLAHDADALLRITRRVPQKRLQGANRTSSTGSARQNSASSHQSHATSVANAAAAMASLSKPVPTNGGMPGQYSFPPHIPQYATAPHAVRLQSDPYMHMQPPGGDMEESGGFTSFKYTRGSGNMSVSAIAPMNHTGQPAPPTAASSALAMPPAGWASEMRVHGGGGYSAVPIPPVPGGAGWHAPWQVTMWGGAPPSHRTSSWSPRGGGGGGGRSGGDPPGSLSPRSAREYIDWAPAASAPSRGLAPVPVGSSSTPAGPGSEHGRYQPGAVARSAFTAGGSGTPTGDRPAVFLNSGRIASGESSPRYVPQGGFEHGRSRSRSPRPLSRPGMHPTHSDMLPRYAAMHTMQGAASDTGNLAVLPALSLQSGRSTSPRPTWLGGELHHGNSIANARHSVSPRTAAQVQDRVSTKKEDIDFAAGDFAGELPRGQAITL